MYAWFQKGSSVLGDSRNVHELGLGAQGRITILTFIFPSQVYLYFYKISSIANNILLFCHQSNNSVSVFEITLQTEFFSHSQRQCFNYHYQSKGPSLYLHGHSLERRRSQRVLELACVNNTLSLSYN